jgi:hypothetical protein
LNVSIWTDSSISQFELDPSIVIIFPYLSIYRLIERT